MSCPLKRSRRLRAMIQPPRSRPNSPRNIDRLMGRLGDSALQRIAVWKLEGHTNDEIAARLGCVTSTVERKLARIRSMWANEIKD